MNRQLLLPTYFFLMGRSTLSRLEKDSGCASDNRIAPDKDPLPPIRGSGARGRNPRPVTSSPCGQGDSEAQIIDFKFGHAFSSGRRTAIVGRFSPTSAAKNAIIPVTLRSVAKNNRIDPRNFCHREVRLFRRQFLIKHDRIIQPLGYRILHNIERIDRHSAGDPFTINGLLTSRPL